MRLSIVAAPVLAIALSGCGNQAENARDGITGDSGAVVQQGAATPLKRGKGVGTVAAIDAGNRSVTLDHGAIPDLNWPAMKMGFAATPDQLAGLQVGDKVDFEIEWNGKTGSLASIRKTQ